MATTLAFLVAGIVLLLAGRDTAIVEPLTPVWSKPLGKGVQLVGVEEYGRCILFADHGAIQVVLPSGETSWSWPYSKISKYINPREVAVSHDCDAIAFVGDASYKYVWVADLRGEAVRIPLPATPSEVAFDRAGQFIAVGTYAGSLHLYSRDGQAVWSRQTQARSIANIWFPEVPKDYVRFNSWAGKGSVSLAGHVESSAAEGEEPDDPTMPPGTNYRWRIAMGPEGSRSWFRGEDSIDCVDLEGRVLATIAVTPSMHGVRVSRDFGQVLVVSEKDLTPVAVELYLIPEGCKVKS